MTKSVVEMRDIRKSFGPTRALKGVDLTVEKGEVHALLGRNGAGKSTLVSALSGLTPSDEGTIRVGDVEIETGHGEYADQIRPLVAHVQQTPQIFDLMTVAENLFIDNPEIEKRFGFISTKKMFRQAEKLLADWKIPIDARALAGTISAESRQLLEIVKAIARGVPMIILDEPTAALTHAEKEILYTHVSNLKEKGISFIYISHHLEEVFEVSDVVTILRDGKVVLSREPAGNLDIPTIAKHMVGEDVVRSSRVDYVQTESAPVMELRDVQIGSENDPKINLSLRPGEIIALGGPVGSGKEDLAMIIAGQKEPFSGSVLIPEGNLPGYVPTDRHRDGYVGLFSIRENIGLGGLGVITNSLGFVQSQTEKDLIASLVKSTDVISSSSEQAVAHLSGGNQQKVVFARALIRSPKVIVAMSPTRGVDVGAKEQLYELLRNLAKDGIGIIVVSDEHEEIDQIANRVAIVFDNEISANLDGDYKIEDLVMKMEGVT